MVDVGYGGCKPRIKGIDKCQYRFCTILAIIKIIKRGGCEWRSEAFVKIQKKKKSFLVGGGGQVGGEGGVGLGVGVDVNGEVTFLRKIQKKIFLGGVGGSGWGGGLGGPIRGWSGGGEG